MVGKFHFPDYLKVMTLESSLKSDFFKVVNSDGTIVYTRDAKFIYLLSEALNFKFKTEYSVDGSFGRDVGNGSWTGLVGSIQRGESDLAILAMSEDRDRVVNFGYPYSFGDVTFLTHKPEGQPKSFALYYPFSLGVWIALLLTLIVVSLLFFLENRNRSFLSILMDTIGSILGKSLRIRFNSYAGRYLYCIWTTGVMLLSYSYKATLLSHLSLPSTRGVENIAELTSAVAEGTYMCMTYKSSYIIDTLLKSSESGIRVIGKSLTGNYFRLNQAQVPPAMSNRKVAFISEKSRLAEFQGDYFISKDVFFTMMFSLATQPEFCYKRILDSTTRRLFETGLFEKISSDRDFLNSLKNIATQTKNKQVLNLQDMAGSFVLLAVGHILSLITFLVEIVHNKFKK